MTLTTSNNSRVITNNLLLLGFVIVLFFLNFYSKTIFYRPSSSHQWRQADCLSIAKNYYEEGMHFFQPKIHYQGPKDGKAVSELPLLNYSVAALWKIFGQHEFIYRLLEYLIYITMIFILYNTLFFVFRSWLLAFFTVSIFLTSPLLTFYSLNFIADVPALSFGFISFCLFLKFYHNKRMGLFYAALAFGTLAVLLKASALIALSLMIFFSVIDICNLTAHFKTEKLFQKKLMPLISIIFSVVLIISWYRYALAYNLNNTNNVFLLTVLPIWEMEEAEIIINLKILFNNLFPLFLNRPMLFFFVMIIIYVIANFRHLAPFYKYSFCITAAYFLCYLIFFYQVFGLHDYYLNNLMIFPMVTFVCFAHIMMQTNFLEVNARFVKIFVIVVVFFNSFYAAAVYRMQMIEDDKLVQWFPFISKDERAMAKFYFWDYNKGVKNVENFTPVLREHGIKREDWVLSLPDQSFNISLYFMDQRGHTIAGRHFREDSTVTRHFKNMNIQYFILSDTSLIHVPAFRVISPHLEKFFSHNSVDVYKVKSSYR